MDLDINNPPISKSKITFLKIRLSLQINPNLVVQVPLPNTVWDTERSNSSSSNRINIIGETPLVYANIYLFDFDKIFTQLESNEDEPKIEELDRILPFARSIQQVLSDPERL